MNRLVCVLLLAAFGHAATAADYFSFLDVRYSHGIKKTFLTGPLSSVSVCKAVSQSTWDNVQPVCQGCRNELQACVTSSELSPPHMSVVRGEKAAFIYVRASEKGRILFSGGARPVLVDACRELAAQFRDAGYKTAACVE
jgi:hypothetical protein